MNRVSRALSMRQVRTREFPTMPVEGMKLHRPPDLIGLDGIQSSQIDHEGRRDPARG